MIHLLVRAARRWKMAPPWVSDDASMNCRQLTAFLWLAAASAGCHRDSNGDPDARTPMPATLAGVYSGEWPCSNCRAIEATLWLRADGSFFLRQAFLDDTEQDPKPQREAPVYTLGRWHWDDRSAEAVLLAPGPERRFTMTDAEHLELRVPSPLAHVLARDASSPPFKDRLLLDGESAVSDRGATFNECRTGLSFTVAETGAYRELKRQHRFMNPKGKVARTTVEAHLVGGGEDSRTSETLVLDRFITLKPGIGC